MQVHAAIGEVFNVQIRVALETNLNLEPKKETKGQQVSL